MALYYCNLCKDEGVSTSMPADEIGAALMQQHLLTEHGVSTPWDFR